MLYQLRDSVNAFYLDGSDTNVNFCYIKEYQAQEVEEKEGDYCFRVF